MALALSPALEDTLQEMERRGAEASRKIDDAVKVVLAEGSAAGDFDFEDPSVVRHVDDLREMRRVTGAPPIGTPPQGSVTPAVGVRIARLVRPPRKPPRDDS
jgi:hypothetical protein